MGLIGIGRGLDVLFRTRSLSASLKQKQIRFLILLTTASAAAVLLNPNGAAVYKEVLSVGAHPNIRSMFEWYPLTLQMKQGKAAAIVFRDVSRGAGGKPEASTTV